MTKEEIEKTAEIHADELYTEGSERQSIIEEWCEWENRKYNFLEGALWYKDYADQETERLKAELSEKDAEIERLEQEKIMLERYCSKYESELTELKERHKKDVMEAFGDGWEKGIARPKLMCVNLEQYYKQKFEK